MPFLPTEDASTDAAPSGGGASASYSLEQILSKCRDLLDCYDYDLAQKFVHRALEMDPVRVRFSY